VPYKSYKGKDIIMVEGIIELTDSNFKSSIEGGLMLVDFWASWCAPCGIIAPVVEEIAQEYKDRIKVGKLNVDDHQKTAADFGIVSIPTIIIFKDAREEARMVGIVPKERINEKIKVLIGE